MESSYAAFEDGQLVLRLKGNEPASALARFVHAQLRALVLSPDASCLGARSAIQQGSYRFGMYPALGSPEATSSLAHDLQVFVAERPTLACTFSSYIASFDGPVPRSERHFERLLWRQLQCLHEQDTIPWETSVASDPDLPDFSFCFAGCSFFVVGLHAGSSRWMRRFAWPTLVFNAHEYFDRLRADGKFERLRDTIRKRDLALQGSINPMMADHGHLSEARQYSGRKVESDWRCPFHATHAAAQVDKQTIVGKFEPTSTPLE